MTTYDPWPLFLRVKSSGSCQFIEMVLRVKGPRENSVAPRVKTEGYPSLAHHLTLENLYVDLYIEDSFWVRNFHIVSIVIRYE